MFSQKSLPLLCEDDYKSLELLTNDCEKKLALARNDSVKDLAPLRDDCIKRATHQGDDGPLHGEAASGAFSSFPSSTWAAPPVRIGLQVPCVDSLRERDDELVRLREQVRIKRRSLAGRREDGVGCSSPLRTPHLDMPLDVAMASGSAEPTARFAVCVGPIPISAENSAAVLEASPHSTLANHVVHLQQQLRARTEETQALEKSLHSKIALLEDRCKILQRHQELAQNHAACIEEDLGAELPMPEAAGETTEERLAILEHVAQAGCHRQHKLQELLARSVKDRQLCAEAQQCAELQASQHLEQLSSERQQWRKEREGLHGESRRRDKAEELLRRQVAMVQERLDNAQLHEAESELERMQLRQKVQQLCESPMDQSMFGQEVAQKNAELHVGSADLGASALHNSIVTAQSREISLLRQELAEAHALLADQSMVVDRLQQTHLADARASIFSSIPPLELPCVTDGVIAAAKGLEVTHGSNPHISLHQSHHDNLHQGSARSRSSSISSSCSSSSRSSSCSSSGCSSNASSSAETVVRSRRPQSTLCAVFGDAPLARVAGVGWHYRLRVNSVSSGWVGGFGIGVTLSTPSTLEKLPDRALCVPRSWLAGYWGRTFADGQERLSCWQPQTLRPGDEVDFLVDCDGECFVFVNGKQCCQFNHVLVPTKSGMMVQLTPLIDISTCPMSVTFLHGAPPPISKKAAARGRGVVPPVPPLQLGAAQGAPACQPTPEPLGQPSAAVAAARRVPPLALPLAME